MSNTFFHNGEEHVMENCYKCKVSHSIPKTLQRAAMQRRGEMTITCPNGHQWVYASQWEINENERIRQERDRLKQQLAQKDDEIERQRDMRRGEERWVIALKGVVTKTKKRISGGACPCCNRSFENFARHMATKHSDYVQKEEVA